MHEVSEFDVKIPEFLVKLWKLVDDPETDDLIRWSDSGKAFVVLKPNEFTKELLPLNFKHSNMSSFNRQLNLYGFQKINHTLESKHIKDSMVFAHTCFIRDHPYLLENIKRKKTTNKSAVPLYSFVRKNVVPNDKNDVQADVLTQILLDVNNLKDKQSSWDAKLANMKRENESLWKELAIFRQKHVKQEQIINKLIHFIVTMVRPSPRNVSIRRRYPLMINDVEGIDKTVSQASNTSIRELDPVEVFLTDTATSPTDDRTVPLIEFGDQPSTSKLPKDGLSYFVSSPENDVVEAEPKLTNWAQIEDYDGEAMTPINPLEACTVTFDPSGSRPAPQPSTSNTSKLVWPNKRQLVASKGKTKNSISGKKLKKNAPVKKLPMKGVSSRNERPNNIIEEALEMIDDSDLGLGDEKDYNSDKTATSNDDEFLKLLQNAVPSTSASSPTTSGLSNTITIPELSGLGSDTDSLAVVKSNTGYNEGDNVARELSSHVDLVQGDIDILKEILKNDSYSIDANTLLELFSEDPMNYVMPNASDVESKKERNELMAYSPPNFVDLMEAYSYQPESPSQPSAAQGESPASSPILETPVATPGTSAFIQSGTKRRKL